MMTTYKINLHQRHPLLNINGKTYLLDTGGQISFSDDGIINFAGTTYKKSTNAMVVSPDTLSSALGTKINGLIGADILSRYTVEINYPENKICVSDNEIEMKGEIFNAGFFMGVPKTNFIIDGREVSLFLDTGAQISYILKDFTEGKKSIGIKNDFYPLIGNFRTEIFTFDVKIGNYKFTAEFGILPSSLEMIMRMTNSAGVIGYDFFIQKVITIDYFSKSISINK